MISIDLVISEVFVVTRLISITVIAAFFVLVGRLVRLRLLRRVLLGENILPAGSLWSSSTLRALLPLTSELVVRSGVFVHRVWVNFCTFEIGEFDLSAELDTINTVELWADAAIHEVLAHLL